MSWLGLWMNVWRARAVNLSSSLSAESAIQRLSQALEEPIQGQVRSDGVLLYSTRPNLGNAWLRTLSASIRPDREGSRLRGEFRCLRFVQIFTGGLIAFLAVTGLAGLAGALIRYRRDAPAGLGGLLLSVVWVAVLVAFLWAVLTFAMRQSRAGEDEVIEWLEDQLHAEKPAAASVVGRARAGAHRQGLLAHPSSPGLDFHEEIPPLQRDPEMALPAPEVLPVLGASEPMVDASEGVAASSEEVEGSVTTDIPVDVFGALAHPVRRRLLEELREGPREAGDLADRFLGSISEHLQVLRQAGLVREEAGRVHLEPLPLTEVDDWLYPFEGSWRTQLHAQRPSD